MKNKQTAVEYLEHQLDWLIKDMSEFIRLSLFNKAKEIEKEQMIKFANDYLDDDTDLTAEQYYNETYEK
jgi:hypothetical protein